MFVNWEAGRWQIVFSTRNIKSSLSKRLRYYSVNTFVAIAISLKLKQFIISVYASEPFANKFDFEIVVRLFNILFTARQVQMQVLKLI